MKLPREFYTRPTSSKSRATCWARNWWCRGETARACPASSSRLKPIAAPKIARRTPGMDGALNAQKRCTELAARPTFISFTACTTSSMSSPTSKTFRMRCWCGRWNQSEGLEVMRRRRRGRSEYELTSGPGRLCLAMGIDRGLDKADLLGDRVWIEEGISISPRQVARGPRIGIDYAEKWVTKPWRFWVRTIRS